MKYQRFEWLTIGVGAAAIFGTLGMTLVRTTTALPVNIVVEMVAQLLLFGVLIAAVHWGRKGGFIAALGATIAYIVMRMPLIVSGGASTEILELVLIHTITYGVVGILGGEMCGRIKYFFARLEDAFNVDEATRVYNQRFTAQLLGNQLAQHRRYGAEFSICLITLSPNLTVDLRPSKVTMLTRTVANHVRDDVRLIDDVGRLDDGRFVLILPHTPASGGAVAAERVRVGVRDVLGAKDESVTAEVLGVPGDIDRIQAFTDSLIAVEEPEA